MSYIIVILCYQRQETVITYTSQIREHINSLTHKIHFYDHMGKMIFNLGNKKSKNNNNCTGHLNHIKKSLLTSIVDTP